MSSVMTCLTAFPRLECVENCVCVHKKERKKDKHHKGWFIIIII